MQVAKRILNWVGNIILGFLIVIFCLTIYSTIHIRRHPGEVPSIMGYRSLTVLSGSMRPYLEPGDMIISKTVNTDDIKVGDVLTYRKTEDILVTHRVIEKNNKAGNIMFKTKGDANNIDDEELISSDKIMGITVLKIPYGGYVSNFIKSKKGFIVLLLIAALILGAGVLKNILFIEKT